MKPNWNHSYEYEGEAFGHDYAVSIIPSTSSWETYVYIRFGVDSPVYGKVLDAEIERPDIIGEIVSCEYGITHAGVEDHNSWWVGVMFDTPDEFSEIVNNTEELIEFLSEKILATGAAAGATRGNPAYEEV